MMKFRKTITTREGFPDESTQDYVQGKHYVGGTVRTEITDDNPDPTNVTLTSAQRVFIANALKSMSLFQQLPFKNGTATAEDYDRMQKYIDLLVAIGMERDIATSLVFA